MKEYLGLKIAFIILKYDSFLLIYIAKIKKLEIILLFDVKTSLFQLFKYRQFEVFTSFFPLPFCVNKTCDDSVMIMLNYIITIF